MKKAPLTKILFVDDDPDILSIAKYCLESLSNTTVKYVTSGEAAVKEALVFLPDLILLDVMMPKMDGMATVSTLRLIPSLTHAPIVFITAKVQSEELEHYLNLGILDVIIKPFDPLTLATTILNIWDKYQDKQTDSE